MMGSKAPSAQPRAAKKSEKPARLKAIGKPSRTPNVATTKRATARISPIRTVDIAVASAQRSGQGLVRRRFPAAEHQYAAAGPRQPLKPQQGDEAENCRLENLHRGHAVVLDRYLASLPRVGDVGPRRPSEQDEPWHQQEDHAEKIDPGFAASSHLGVENVDPYMGIEEIGESRREQEGHRMRPDVEFLHPYEAYSCGVAQENDGSTDQHGGQCEPGHGAPDAPVDPIDCIDGTHETVHLYPLVRRSLTRYARPWQPTRSAA